MFNLNLKTAASSSGPAAPSATPIALNEVPWTVIDADEGDSFESVASQHSGEGNNGNLPATSATTSPQLNEPQALFDQDPYPHCPIFIPSKGRSDLDRSTMATFIRDLVPFVLVVEQDEAASYSAQLDRLVGQTFGFAGMVYSSPTTNTAPASPQPEGVQEKFGAPSAALGGGGGDGSDLWDFPCACCCGNGGGSDRAAEDPAADASEKSDGALSSSSAAASGQPPSTALTALAQRLSTAFHHGYVFEPPTQEDSDHNEMTSSGGSVNALDDAAADQANTGRAATTSVNAGASVAADLANTSSSFNCLKRRRATPAFILRDVDEIRSLFRIEVLPESNRGVSYVRNYILQVLVPRVMVGCGVDRTGNIEELCLSGPGKHSTLTPAALRSAGLATDVYNTLQSKSDLERYLDQRRRRASPQTTAAGDATAGSSNEAARRPASPSLHAGNSSGNSGDGSSTSASLPRDTPRLLHGLFGFYWVLDDDIYGFYALQGSNQKQQRITTRAMLREVESRLRRLRRNADVASPPPPAVPPACFQLSANGLGSGSSGGVGGGNANGGAPASNPSGYFNPQRSYSAAPQLLHHQQQQQPFIFTSKEDALANNFISGGKGKPPSLQNYANYYTTACFSLEYNRFALGAAPDSLAVNSYNNIACLFNYSLLHNPPQMRYFPPGVPNVRRPEDALVGYLGHSMLWYRFAIREDYDFTLQLIARGLYTLRFRNLSFDVPQMMKVRGGMTDYYRNCHEEIRQQNDRFVLQWPAIAQHWVKGKDDTKRDDIRVRWDLLSPARTKYPGAFLYLTTPLPQLQPQLRGPEDVVEPEADAETAADNENGSGERKSSGDETHKRARPASPLASGGGQSAVPRTEVAGASAHSSSPSPSLSSSSPLFGGASGASSSTAPTATAARERKLGYVVERWRDISPQEARQHVGLRALPNDTIHIGQTVAAIPPFFEQQPSVVLATVIERSTQEETSGEGGAHVVWTAVAQDVRGMPFLHIKTCYQPPEEGIVKAAEKLDQFFAGISE